MRGHNRRLAHELNTDNQRLLNPIHCPWNVHSAQPVLTAGAGPRIQPSESNVLFNIWTGYVTEPS